MEAGQIGCDGAEHVEIFVIKALTHLVDTRE